MHQCRVAAAVAAHAGADCLFVVESRPKFPNRGHMARNTVIAGGDVRSGFGRDDAAAGANGTVMTFDALPNRLRVVHAGRFEGVYRMTALAEWRAFDMRS